MNSKKWLVPLVVMAAMTTVCASAQASSIAFLRGGNIWIANPDGSGAHALTSDGGYTYVSAAKVGGSMLLAFHQGDSLGLINADGSGRRTFAAPAGFGTSPDVVIDPSGHQLAYTGVTGFGNYGSVTDLTGSTKGDFANYQSQVLDVGWADPSGTVGLWAGYLSKAPGNIPHPICAPSGGSEQFGIAFQQVYYDFNAPAPATTGFFCILGQDVLEPKGSPDGTQVLASAGPHDGATRIIEVAESTMRSFSQPGPSVPFTYETPSSINAGDPDWAPDGSQLAFDSSPAPGSSPNQVWVTRAGGNGTPALILSDASNPAWSPYTLPGSNPNNNSTTTTTTSTTSHSTSGTHCKVPTLRGLTKGQAKQKLRRADCALGKVRKGSGRGKHGHVIKQSVKPGRKLRAGSKVGITIKR